MLFTEVGAERGSDVRKARMVVLRRRPSAEWRAAHVGEGPMADGNQRHDVPDVLGRATFLVLSFVLFCAVVVPPLGRVPFSMCLYRLVLGQPCPGCGMTRSFLLLGHGRLAQAVELNPLSVVAFPLMIGLWLSGLRGLVVRLRGRARIGGKRGRGSFSGSRDRSRENA